MLEPRRMRLYRYRVTQVGIVDYSFVSSSFVKEIVSHKHSVEGLVPACVEKKLIEKYRG